MNWIEIIKDERYHLMISDIHWSSIVKRQGLWVSSQNVKSDNLEELKKDCEKSFLDFKRKLDKAVEQ